MRLACSKYEIKAAAPSRRMQPRRMQLAVSICIENAARLRAHKGLQAG